MRYLFLNELDSALLMLEIIANISLSQFVIKVLKKSALDFDMPQFGEHFFRGQQIGNGISHSEYSSWTQPPTVCLEQVMHTR